MSEQDRRIVELREEFWRLEDEAPKPKAVHVLGRERARAAEIKAELAELNADVGPRPTGGSTV